MRHRLRHLSPALFFLAVTVLGVAITPLATALGPFEALDSSDSRDYLMARMVALTETVRHVESMVEDRSRNVLALRANATRIERLTQEIDALFAAGDSSESLPEVYTSYAVGRDTVLAAIEEARSALRSFDFSGMEALVDDFQRGGRHLDDALTLLQNAV